MRDFRSPASLKRPASASLSPLSSLRYHFSAFRFHKSYYHPIPYNSQRLSIDSSKLCKARQLWSSLSPSPACRVCLRTTRPSLSHSSIQSFPSYVVHSLKTCKHISVTFYKYLNNMCMILIMIESVTYHLHM